MTIDFLRIVYQISIQPSKHKLKLALTAFKWAAIAVAASMIFLQGAQYVELLCLLVGVVFLSKRGGVNRSLLVGVYSGTIFCGFALTSLLLLNNDDSSMDWNIFLFVIIYFYFPPMVLIPTLGALIVSTFGNWSFKPKPVNP